MSAQNHLGHTRVALIDLYQLDLAPIGYNIQLYFCNFSQSNGANIAFQGRPYVAYPIEASGFEKSIQGSLPTPSLSVSNVFADISSLIINYQGLGGAKLTRIQILASNIDGTAGANSSDIESTEIYYISSYIENSKEVKFNLKHPLALDKLRLPRKRIATVTGD